MLANLPYRLGGGQRQPPPYPLDMYVRLGYTRCMGAG